MYQRSSLLLNPDRCQLLVIDVQERLMPAMANGPEIVFNAHRLLNAAAIFGVSVVVSEQYPKGLGPTVESVLAAVPQGSLILQKKAFSVCGDEGLLEILEGSTLPLVLCGAEAHVCVLQSAMDLLSMGRDVFLVADAVGSRSHRDAEIALRRLDSAGATLTTTEAVLFEWCQSAENRHFKAVSALAKETQSNRS